MRRRQLTFGGRLRLTVALGDSSTPPRLNLFRKLEDKTTREKKTAGRQKSSVQSVDENKTQGDTLDLLCPQSLLRKVQRTHNAVCSLAPHVGV